MEDTIVNIYNVYVKREKDEVTIQHGNEVTKIKDYTLIALSDATTYLYGYWLGTIRSKHSEVTDLKTLVAAVKNLLKEEPKLKEEYEWVVSEDIQIIKGGNHETVGNTLVTSVPEDVIYIEEGTLLELRDITGTYELQEGDKDTEGSCYFVEYDTPFEIPFQFTRQQIKEESCQK